MSKTDSPVCSAHVEVNNGDGTTSVLPAVAVGDSPFFFLPDFKFEAQSF